MTRRLVAALALLVVALTGCGGSDGGGAGEPLTGTFRLDAGSCDGATLTGTYFRMISVGGDLEAGPFFENPDSTCDDRSYTVLEPGTDGGVLLGEFQPAEDEPFDPQGNALAARITRPGSFTAIDFGVSTASKDPQGGDEVPAPELFVEDGEVTGQVRAWTASWNNLYFNQGSPKPDGSTPGITAPVSGTYDEETGRLEITWVSEIVGGPFDRFSGAWHLAGTLEPAS